MSWMDDIVAEAETAEAYQDVMACTFVGNTAALPVTAQRTDLNKNWHPTGYYSPDQVKTILGEVQGMAAKAAEMLDAGLANLSSRDESAEFARLIRNERTQLDQALGRAQKFIDAVNAVEAHGSGVVDAPGLKAWVISTLGYIDNSITAAAAIACLQPWWAGLYKGFVKAANLAWEVIKAIGGLAADAVIAAGEFIASVPDTAATLLKIIKWTAILGGGLLAVMYIRRELQSRNLIPEQWPEAWKLPD